MNSKITKNPMMKKMTENLKFNINRANEIIRLFENRRAKFIEINLALITTYSFLFVFILNTFNDSGKLSMLTSILCYLACSTVNIIYILRENKTIGTKKVLCYHRSWNNNDLKNIDWDKDFDWDEDYTNQIISLHKYQENYNKIATNTRIITLTGLLVLFVTFSITMITTLLANINPFLNLVFGFNLIIIIINVVATVMIVGFIYYFKIH